MINELRIKYPFRNEQVVGSNPTSGSIITGWEYRVQRMSESAVCGFFSDGRLE
jgi:hypothetical protein